MKKPCGSWETLSGQAVCLRSHSKSRDTESQVPEEGTVVD